MTGNLLIRGGTVVDGTGGAPFLADMRIRGGRIAEIELNLASDGEQVIDASGALVTPGFIDTHTHLDPALFWDRRCDPLTLHGVTTAYVGNCSLSLAPVRDDQRASLISVFGYVEDLNEEMLATALPWSWQTQRELHAALAGGLGINVAFLVGHTPLRLYVMGAEAWERTATDQEIAEMASILDDSLAAGAQGMSTSFFDTDATGRPVPSAIADDLELGALLDVLAKWGFVLEFIPDLRRADYRSDIERVAALCGPRGVRATWNGLFDFGDRPDFAPGVLNHASLVQSQGAQIFPQVSPRSLDTRINWDSGMTLMRLKEGWWRYVQAAGPDKAALLSDPDWRATARSEWDRPEGGLLTGRLDKIRLLSAVNGDDEKWIGRTLRDLVAAEGGHPSDVLADWVRRNDGHPEVVIVGVGNDDPDAVATQLLHPASIISNSDAGAHVQTFCPHGDTTEVLITFVRERGDLTLEGAVHELTGRQADVFSLADRGRLRVGALGDVAIFTLDELTYADDQRASDLPGGDWRLRRPWGGYRYTIVGGTIVQEGGRYTTDLPGVVVGAS